MDGKKNFIQAGKPKIRTWFDQGVPNLTWDGEFSNKNAGMRMGIEIPSSGLEPCKY